MKQELENEADCGTHACTHCRVLLKIPCQVNKTAKKGINSGSYYMVHAQRHLKNNCNEECLNSVIDSLQSAELKDAKHDEEVIEK